MMPSGFHGGSVRAACGSEMLHQLASHAPRVSRTSHASRTPHASRASNTSAAHQPWVVLYQACGAHMISGVVHRGDGVWGAKNWRQYAAEVASPGMNGTRNQAKQAATVSADVRHRPGLPDVWWYIGCRGCVFDGYGVRQNYAQMLTAAAAELQALRKRGHLALLVESTPTHFHHAPPPRSDDPWPGEGEVPPTNFSRVASLGLAFFLDDPSSYARFLALAVGWRIQLRPHAPPHPPDS